MANCPAEHRPWRELTEEMRACLVGLRGPALVALQKPSRPPSQATSSGATATGAGAGPQLGLGGRHHKPKAPPKMKPPVDWGRAAECTGNG